MPTTTVPPLWSSQPRWKVIKSVHDAARDGFELEVTNVNVTAPASSRLHVFIPYETLASRTASASAYEAWLTEIADVLIDDLVDDEDAKTKLLALGAQQLTSPITIRVEQPNAGPNEVEVEQAINSIKQTLDEHRDS